MSHQCAAPGCDRIVSDAMLMCAGHWKRVPELAQHSVWRTWRALQRSTANTYFARVDAYNKAKAAAVATLADKAAA